MGKSYATVFFFAQTYNKTESDYVEAINSLYAGLKKDKHNDPYLEKIIEKYSGESTIQLLCKILNKDEDAVLEMNAVYAKRHLMSYHANNASKAVSAQKQQEEQQTNRR